MAVKRFFVFWDSARNPNSGSRPAGGDRHRGLQAVRLRRIPLRVPPAGSLAAGTPDQPDQPAFLRTSESARTSKEETARNALAKGYTPVQVRDITGLDLETLERLRNR